jgi:phenylpropionate dioxygenase-like ring-hydroxylating dioxygenase large terminal subunit
MAAMSLSSSNANAREMMWKFWYPALRMEQVRRNKLVRAMLLDVPLVLGRDTTGKPFALRDVCPHRGFPLSFGQFDGANVECAYHGWKFNAHTGQCNAIPSLTEGSKLKCERIYAGSFPCEERDGYVWAYMTNPEGRGLDELPPPAPELPKFGGKFETAQLHAELPCGVDQAIIGLMDPAHGPFVHQAWWWRSRHSIHEKQKNFEPIPMGFRMSAHTPSSNSAPYKLLRLYADADSITTTIDFVLPNLRLETIRAGKYWFSSLTTVTPITRSHCRIDVVACWNIFRWVPFGPALLKFVFAKFVEQDRQTMENQSEGLKHNPHLMLIDDADRPAKWYFQLKAAYLESRRTDGEMRHPMNGPVTLKWRS